MDSTFYVAGLPIPTPVRDPDTGNIVDGYRLTVVSNQTGARAVIEIPETAYSADNVQKPAEYKLGIHDSVLSKFAAPQPKG